MSEDVPPLHCRLIAFPVGRNRGEGSAVSAATRSSFAVCFWSCCCALGKVAVLRRPFGWMGASAAIGVEGCPVLSERAGVFPGGMPLGQRPTEGGGVVLSESRNWRPGRHQGGCLGRSMAWPGSQEPTRRIFVVTPRQSGPHCSGSGSSGAGSTFDAAAVPGGCSAGVKPGFPAASRTRLAELSPPECNQRKCARGAKPRANVLQEAAHPDQGIQRDGGGHVKTQPIDVKGSVHG